MKQFDPEMLYRAHYNKLLPHDTIALLPGDVDSDLYDNVSELTGKLVDTGLIIKDIEGTWLVARRRDPHSCGEASWRDFTTDNVTVLPVALKTIKVWALVEEIGE